MEFNRLRVDSRALAWKFYQQKLNENLGLLSEIFNPKDLVDLSMKIEDWTKSDSGSVEGSGLDEARRFLGVSTEPVSKAVN
jgi:hypothetical protein